MPRVLIVDDHAIVRKGLCHVLASSIYKFEVAEAESGDEALAQLRKTKFDAVVLDLSLPDRSGLEVLKLIKAEFAGLPVMVLSVHAEEQYAVPVLRSGASAYLSKSAVPDELVRALTRVIDGSRYLTPALSEKLALEFVAGKAELPHERLSSREFEVLCLLASGKSVTEAARRLRLSVKTVSTHRAHILQKMNLSTTTDLIQYAVRHGLLE